MFPTLFELLAAVATSAQNPPFSKGGKFKNRPVSLSGLQQRFAFHGKLRKMS
jgi:hypothetical protein